MKVFSYLCVFFLSLFFVTGCTGNKGNKQETEAAADTLNQPDSIVRAKSGNYVVSEISYKNGRKNGLTKTFYPSGRVRTTRWYVNDMLQDSSIWYYEEGQIFRVTPYYNDTIDGVQKQYYRTGQLKARLGYSRGLRTTYFEEFTKEGKLVKDYPQVVVETKDTYKTNGRFTIMLSLSDKRTNVKFFRGDFIKGRYDTAKVQKIPMLNNTGTLVLKKSGSPRTQYVGVIAEIMTNFGNRFIVAKKVDLLYNDLK
jgi:hypothetical protein